MSGQRLRLGPGLLLAAALALVSGAVAVPTSAVPAKAVPRGVLPVSGTIKVCRCASGITADPVTGTVWVAYGQYNKIVVFSERSLRLVATIPLAPGGYPSGMAADPGTGVVWVANLGHVSEISGRHLSVLRTIQTQLTNGPQEIAVDPKAGKVWVTIDPNFGASGVLEIGEATGKTGPTVPVPPFTRAVAVDQNAGTVWATGNRVADISEAGDSVIAKLRLPGTATGIAADPVARKVWVVTNIYRPRVFEVDPASHRVIAQIPVRFWPPSAVAADPGTGTVWVTAGANHLSLISEGRQAVTRTLKLAGGPAAVAVDSRSHMVFTLNPRDGTVNFYRYSAPRFTTAPHASFRVGAFGRFVVRAQGFPLAVMSVRGRLPAGLHATTRLNALVISGTPASSDRPGSYHVNVMADNGIGTPADSYVFVQHLVIRLTA